MRNTLFTDKAPFAQRTGVDLTSTDSMRNHARYTVPGPTTLDTKIWIRVNTFG